MATQQFDRYARIVVIALIGGGCLLVLRPFIGAILFSAIICVTTWPLFAWLRRVLGGRPVVASLGMVLLLVLVVMVPVAVVAGALTQYTGTIVEYARKVFSSGPPALPEWLTGLPFFGAQIDAYWRSITESREALTELLGGMVQPLRNFLLALAAILGEGLLQLALVAFVCFFMYRDGEALMRGVRESAERLAGPMAERLIDIADSTVGGVIYGILGTALAQALVALAGFLVAGVPLALLLATATFFLSMVPIGPPLVWGGAAAWLAGQGMNGWAIFMVLYGLLVISSIDNFVKPYLISRGSAQPLVFVFLGVLGGVLAFGFIGIFLGPVLLAVAFSLLRHWLAGAVGDPPEGPIR